MAACFLEAELFLSLYVPLAARDDSARFQKVNYPLPD
jgi:hypothetical protein